MRNRDTFDPNISENSSWLSIADLVGEFVEAPIGLVGAPLGRFSITPGGCDRAPAALRAALKRMSVYDVETRMELRDIRIFDWGDVPLDIGSLDDARAPIAAAVASRSTSASSPSCSAATTR